MCCFWFFFKVLLTLRLCFTSFRSRDDIGHNSRKFIISSKFILHILSMNIFHKKLLNICHANGSHTVTSFAMPSRLLGAPTVLNRIRLVWNFVFAKFFSISKKITLRSSKTKPFVLVILQKNPKTIFLTNFCLVLLQIYSLLMNNIQDRSSYQRYSVKKGVCSLPSY